ncbi:riboflavin kinase, partial [Candidatus Roizmanbacteria bacterium]|nr:riboflavin kinase [Candidatus Roizmanbacteria bacterium]
MWYEGLVMKGTQHGRKIGFPTINLDPKVLTHEIKEGVYAAEVLYQNRIYKGALYFGPRLVKNETHTVLEIHIINFAKQIYTKLVKFRLRTFIRAVMNFKSMEELQKQI